MSASLMKRVETLEEGVSETTGEVCQLKLQKVKGENENLKRHLEQMTAENEKLQQHLKHLNAESEKLFKRLDLMTNEASHQKRKLKCIDFASRIF